MNNNMYVVPRNLFALSFAKLTNLVLIIYFDACFISKRTSSNACTFLFLKKKSI